MTDADKIFKGSIEAISACSHESTYTNGPMLEFIS